MRRHTPSWALAALILPAVVAIAQPDGDQGGGGD